MNLSCEKEQLLPTSLEVGKVNNHFCFVHLALLVSGQSVRYREKNA